MDEADEQLRQYQSVSSGDLVVFTPAPGTTVYSSQLNGMIGVVTECNRRSTVAMVLMQDGIPRWMPQQYLRHL
jgi:hypothetical protein